MGQLPGILAPEQRSPLPLPSSLVQLQTTFSDMPAQGAGQLARKGLLPETIRCRQGFQAWLV